MTELKTRIDQMSSFLSTSNLYEMLGVTPEATKTEITTSFRALAKDWHIDRFSSHDLGDYNRKLQEIFATLNKAHQTLSNKTSREEYDDEISGKAKGASIGNILQANAEFNQGKNMMRSGAYAGAYQKFQNANEKQPDDPQYSAYLIFCEYQLISKNPDGSVKSKTRANEIFTELDGIAHILKDHDWLMMFLGTVAAGIGKERTARSLFAEALMINPGNHEAQRQIRLIKRRKDSSSTGFFSKLFKKK